MPKKIQISKKFILPPSYQPPSLPPSHSALGLGAASRRLALKNFTLYAAKLLFCVVLSAVLHRNDSVSSEKIEEGRKSADH